MPIVMPDVDTLLVGLLRPALDPAGVGTLVPPDLTDRLPFVVARCYGGDSRDPRLVFRALVSVDVFTADRPSGYNLAEQVRFTLLNAYLRQTVTTSGSIANFVVNGWPAELREPDAPSGVIRYAASYALTIRPPR